MATSFVIIDRTRAFLVGIPLYSNAAGIIPIVQVLHDKGLPMGTLLATFVGVVGLGIIFVGYLFNAILH